MKELTIKEKEKIKEKLKEKIKEIEQKKIKEIQQIVYILFKKSNNNIYVKKNNKK